MIDSCDKYVRVLISMLQNYINTDLITHSTFHSRFSIYLPPKVSLGFRNTERNFF